jgi:hypothetical protein
VAVLLASIGVVLLAASPAFAASRHVESGFAPPFGLFGISVSGILRTIAKLLFNVLAGAFLPSWLRHAPQDALRWLIALPDPADPVQWPTMHRLEQDTTAVAVAFLPLTFAIAVLRYTASGVTGGAHHPAESLGRLVGAAAGLLLLPWGFQNAVATVNVTTSTLLSYASIDHGLQRALTLMFVGGVAFGVTGPVVALLVIGAILLAVGLFMIKVGLLALFALLYVAGPLALALSPVPELHGAWRVWLGMLVALALIPVGWCLIFAVAGAISADITHIGTPAAIGTRLVGFFAGVLTFFIAFRWPFFLIDLVRSRGLLSGEMLGGASPGAARSSTGTVTERVRQSRAALLAGAGAAGGAISHVGGALGAPRGGLVGAAGRGGAKAAAALGSTPLLLRSRQGLAASWQAVRAKSSATAPGRGGTRLTAAGRIVAAAPAAVRAALAERDDPRAARAAAEQTFTRAEQARKGAKHGSGANGQGRSSSAGSAQAAKVQSQPARLGSEQPRGRAAVDSAAAAAAAAAAGRQLTQANKVAAPERQSPPQRPVAAATDRPLEKPAKPASNGPSPQRVTRPVRPKGHGSPKADKQPPRRPRKEP